jgi:tetratricopeptide (TPR) repeat protein
MFDAIDALSEPYPGLRPFRRDETHIFFGREATIDDMIERLAAHHFLAVTGPSGSGKSSLVFTGLLDALDRGLLIEAGSVWRVADFRPGGEPFARLAKALLAATGAPASAETRALTEAKLARGPFGLVQLLDEIEFPAKSNLLVLVDQFEEIFRFRQDPASDEIDAFVALLLASAKQTKRPICVVITMRSDFLGECAQFANLAETINDGQFLTPRLTRDQCRQAIEEPARVYGGCVEEDLVTRLLNDMGGNPDQLPLLQHALMLLWQRARERAGNDSPLLTLADYESVGGIGTRRSPPDTAASAESQASNGALSDHADRVLSALTSEQQGLAEILFRALTESGGAGGRDVRRPISLAKAAAIAEVPVDNLIPVIEAFRAPGRNFLAPPAPEPLRPETMIDISHESLIRQWVKLRRWVREEYLSAETYRGIVRSAKQWQNGLGNLLMSLDLAVARKWRKTERPNAAWAERYGNTFGLATEFLSKSERRRFWRRGLTATAIIAPILLIAGATYMTAVLVATLPYMNPGNELFDYRISPQAILKQENIASETPMTIPGGEVISTTRLKAALDRGTIGGTPFVLIDALNSDHQTISKAETIRFAGRGGNFQDAYQQQLEEKLKALTGNRLDMPLVFFCQGVKCWESYNACLRAIHLGYTHVYWYRGGLVAWTEALNIAHRFENSAREFIKADSGVQIKLSTVVSNIPETFRTMRRAFFPSGDETQVVQSNIDNTDYYSRGVANANSGMHDAAILDFKKAITLNPENSEAYYNLGRSFEIKGDYEDAMPNFLKAAELNPAKNEEIQARLLDQKYASAFSARGLSYYNKNDLDLAISEYDLAIRLNQEYGPAYNGRGNVYYRKSDYDRAIEDYSHAMQYNPQNTVYIINRGAAYSRKREYDHAIVDFDAAIVIDSKNIRAYTERGIAYSGKRDYDRAIKNFDQAIQLNPKYVNAFTNRGEAYLGKRNYDHAIADFDAAIVIDSKNVRAYTERGIAYSGKRDYEQAIKNFDQAIQLNPKYVNAFRNRGIAHIDQENYANAIKDLNQAIALDSGNADNFYARSRVYIQERNYSHAIEDASEAIKRRPSDVNALWLRAQAMLYSDRAGSAADDLVEALKLQPTNAYLSIWLHMARMRAGQDDSDELASNASKLDQAQWPYPIVRLFLGSLSPETLVAATRSQNESTQRDQVCRAGFYLGVYQAGKSERDLAREWFQLATDTCAKNFREYHAAKIELDRLL